MNPPARPNTPVDHPSGAAEAPTGNWGTADTHAPVLPFNMRPAAEAPPPAAPAPALGTDFGPYELLGEVARGGMGVVYKARQRGLDRVVALKMVLGSQLGAGAVAERFIQEARAAAALDHPNVVSIYDTGEINGQVYFTMAFVDGADLKDHVATHGLLPIPDVLTLFVQIVSGVAHAHSKGIIHRDLKPANVLLDKGGRPRVTDFGLAKRTTSDVQLTGTGQVMGTPAYMPPEQAKGARDVGPAADVYSLGGILYFLLTGRPPFDGGTITELLIKLVSDAPEPPSAINAEVPPELEEICLLCLSKDPADRFPDAGVLLDALLSLTDAHGPRSSSHRLSGVTPRPSSPMLPAGMSPTITRILNGPAPAAAPPVEPVAPTPVRRRYIPWLAAAAVLLLVGGVLLVTRPWASIPVKDDRPSEIAAGVPYEWPAAVAGDFPVSVEIVTPPKETKDGVAIYTAGQVVKFQIKAERKCSATLWWLDPTGKAVKLYPNEYDGNADLEKGEVRQIPGNRPGTKPYEIYAFPTEGTGVERLRLLATTGTLPSFPRGEPFENVYAALTTPKDRDQLASTIRGFGTRPTGVEVSDAAPKVAQAEIKFRVAK